MSDSEVENIYEQLNRLYSLNKRVYENRVEILQEK